MIFSFGFLLQNLRFDMNDEVPSTFSADVIAGIVEIVFSILVRNADTNFYLFLSSYLSFAVVAVFSYHFGISFEIEASGFLLETFARMLEPINIRTTPANIVLIDSGSKVGSLKARTNTP